MDLLRQRLYTQRLTGPPLERPEDVVRLLGAVQSQDYPGAKWSVGQRMSKGTEAVVDDAFSSGRMLRTHILRPTWHFVAPDDIRWMLQLTSPRVQTLNAFRYRQLELDEALLRRTDGLFARALEGGNQLTRAELAAVLRRGGIAAAADRLAHVVMHAELEGVICSGALRGKQHTYALLEERTPGARTMAGDEALAELTYRFFSGHGPATPAHYAWWSGLKTADVRSGIAMNQGHLTSREVSGRTYWLGELSRSPAKRLQAAAYLLPEFDEAILGYKDLGWGDEFVPAVLIGGKRAGTWRRTMGRDEVVVETRLVAELSAAGRRALETAAERYGAFLGRPVALAHR
ncbi:MAG: winged helix DNA-binding domain-containing protein [Gemmatimonadales bacterium]|nr:winged helix DNA-binding domain-containing protein [Gemmatimonadales bacterium]